MLAGQLHTLLPNFSVRLMAAMLEEEGLKADPVFREAGLRRGDVEKADGLVTGQQEADAQAAFFGMTKDHPRSHALWYQLGRRYRVLSFGSAGRAGLTSRTIGGAIEAGKNLHALTFTFGINRPVYRGSDIVGLDLCLENVRDDMKVFTSCRDFGATITTLNDLWGNQFPFEYSNITFDSRHVGIFDQGSLAEADRTMWRWARSASGKSLCMADASLNKIYLMECDARLGKEELSWRITRVVADRFMSGRANRVTVDAVADDLGLHTRTLQRRLSERGMTFREIVREAQLKAAQQMLIEQGLPLDEIAFRLGYSDVTAFARAFREWTGSSPGRFRSRAGQELAGWQ
jgi:AraC-like DNA-binding protein